MNAQTVMDNQNKYRFGVLIGNENEERFGLDLVKKNVKLAKFLKTTKINHTDIRSHRYIYNEIKLWFTKFCVWARRTARKREKLMERSANKQASPW